MGEIISAGIDWITLSAPRGGLDHCLTVVGERLAELAQAGYDTKDVVFPGGYQGWGIGPISWLEKDQAQLLVVSGGTAGEFGDDIMARAPDDSRLTRLDLQVTVADAQVLGVDMKKAATDNSYVRTVGEIISPGGGHTVYIGSRRSAQFGRFYAKLSTALESWPAYTWRWEVEFKKPAADRVWERLRNAKLCDMVRTWYLDRNLPVDWPAGSDAPMDGLSAREIPDFDRKLEWVRRQVRPFALDSADKDRLHDFLKAIGIATSPIVAQKALDILAKVLK